MSSEADTFRLTLAKYQALVMFIPIVNRDLSVRTKALDSLIGAIIKYESTMSDDGSNGNNVLYNLLPIILLHTKTCPFDEVRAKLYNLLIFLQEKGCQVPRPLSTSPSSFIPKYEIVPNNSTADKSQMLFIDAFLQNNRLDHVSQVMSYHPHYLESFLRTQHFILRGDGPLPYAYRHYIAIMAAGRHQCSYLVHLQKQEFLLQGGEPTWLKGLDHIPKKLKQIYELNKLLAHRPWLVNRTHIEKLTKGKDSWSISEVVHAIVLLVHFHSMSSFVFGCGINAEVDDAEGHTFSQPGSPGELVASLDGNLNKSNSNSPVKKSPSSVLTSSGVEVLMQKMKTLSESAQEEATTEEMVKRFEKVESQTAEISAVTDFKIPPKADISKYIEDPTFVYEDFAKRGELTDIQTFRVQDYSWDDHGYSLVNRLYNDVGTLLDEKFKTAYNLTYYTMGTKKNVDTTLFRRAIWNYIHCMFGIRHDDYDYGEVNHMLDRDLKAYIKAVCCYPERTSKKHYDSIMRDFLHSEKVHVSMMMLEARMQGELLYALRAVMRYMT